MWGWGWCGVSLVAEPRNEEEEMGQTPKERGASRDRRRNPLCARKQEGKRLPPPSSMCATHNTVAPHHKHSSLSVCLVVCVGPPPKRGAATVLPNAQR